MRALLGSVLLFVVLLVAVGCGSPRTVQVGEPGQSGVIKRDVDKAQSTADEASDRIRRGEREVYGG